MNGLEIMRAGRRQAAVLGTLQAKCWQAAYQNLLSPAFLRTFTPRARRAVVARAMREASGAEFYLAKIGGERAGFLVLAPARDSDVPAAGEVTAIYLLPAYWGGGHGGRMLRFATERLAALGYETAILWVLEENKRARNFYEHMGWTADGEKRMEAFGAEERPCLRYCRNLHEGQGAGII